MPSRLSVVPSVPPAIVLFLSVAGQLKEPVALLALVGGGLVVLWTVALVVALMIQLLRKEPFAPLVVGLSLSVLAVLGALSLVVTAPVWAQWRAEPAIAAIEQSRVETGTYPVVGSLDGDFPSSLLPALKANGQCIYKPRKGSYLLVCMGGPFSRCGYDGATKRWALAP